MFSYGLTVFGFKICQDIHDNLLKIDGINDVKVNVSNHFMDTDHFCIPHTEWSSNVKKNYNLWNVACFEILVQF